MSHLHKANHARAAGGTGNGVAHSRARVRETVGATGAASVPFMAPELQPMVPARAPRSAADVPAELAAVLHAIVERLPREIGLRGLADAAGIHRKRLYRLTQTDDKAHMTALELYRVAEALRGFGFPGYVRSLARAVLPGCVDVLLQVDAARVRADRAFARLIREAGDVDRVRQDALADGEITPDERARIQAESDELAAAAVEYGRAAEQD